MPYAQPLKAGDPDMLGDYELVGRLGEGGQGVVYLGMHPATGPEPYAVKLLHGSVGQEREAFLREVELAKQVARFCTAQVVGAGLADDRPYIVSEYVDGPSLHREVAVGGPRAGGGLERLAIGTATALAAIHRAGIVHRDLKPQNVLLGPDGPRVIDFGLARALDAAATQTGRGAGTPAYMAPEQVEGAAIDPAADVFSWGATMCFAANGQAPFGQDSIAAVLRRILTAPPELGRLDGWLGALVAECLSKSPADRPTSRELLLALLGDGDGDVRRAARGAAAGGASQISAAVLPMAAGAAVAGGSIRSASGPPGSVTGGAPAAGSVPDLSGEPAGIRTHPGRAATRASVAMSGSLLISAAVLVAVLVPALSGNGVPAGGGPQVRPPVGSSLQADPGEQPDRGTPAVPRADQGPRRGGPAGSTGDPETTAPPPAAGIAVPALAGMDRSEALRAIKRAGLAAGTVAPADSREPIGRVLRTWPAAGSTVAKGSKVDLEVSAGVPVPELAGLRRKAAEALLVQAGLVPGGATPRCSDSPGGQVLSSTPGAGERVSAGASVALTVARRGAETPAVTGLGEAEARRALTAAGLSARARPRLVTDSAQAGVVLAQNPAPGSCARPGGRVTITVGVEAQTGPGPGEESPPPAASADPQAPEPGAGP
ncbi:PASTA domain-containing protein [Planomonospora sp. ID67723]|uniref:serine/threonine-protein kinase n=1 Tax=Planomonospora sp. ID67723 TaxID=2738134 RepID=UPI0018C4489F|nr:serine/threonine-protein kinase [Planomonospora sp. ID67723]MBG0828675.1 PASTA domain-containing protein [Planomonospora sp. ID67723]